MTGENILQMRDLRIEYGKGAAAVRAVRGASIDVAEGQTVGIVGESGSGKSTVARTLLGLLPPDSARVTGGSIVLAGTDVTHFTPQQWQSMRGSPAAMVFQDPLTFLNPVKTIFSQVAEGVRFHDPGVEVKARVAQLLDMVKLPRTAAQCYPYELSGGMRQRVLLAIALGCRPRLLVADEPTTALDVTTQAEVMELLRELRSELGMAMLLISHDLGLISSICEKVYVMYGGQTIEWGTRAAVFGAPAHPYTRGLLASAEGCRSRDGLFVTIPGDVPNLRLETSACPFLPRCADARDVCAVHPEARVATKAHLVRCHFAGDAA